MIDEAWRERIERWEEAMGGEVPREALRREVIEALSPRTGEAWPAEALLAVLDLEAMGPVLEGEVEDPELEQVLADAMRWAMPHRQEWSGGVLLAQREALRRQWEREEEKARLVGEHMERADEGRRQELARAYLATDPAAACQAELEERFEAAFEAAREARGEGLDALVDDRRLLEMLRFEDGEAPMKKVAARASLEALHQRWDGAPILLKKEILGDREEGRLAAAALALYRGDRELAQALVAAVVRGLGPAPTLAAFAGVLDAELTRDGLGRFLVDALNDDTPREALVIDAGQLAEAMAAARAVLPLAGSPVEALEAPTAEAKAVVEATRRAYAFGQALAGKAGGGG